MPLALGSARSAIRGLQLGTSAATPRTKASVEVRGWAIAVGCGLSLAVTAGASAQDSAFQALAEHLTAPKQGPYRGPTVGWPETPARPERGALRARSSSLPLIVHARRGVPEREAHATLAALERAYTWLDAHGFALPGPSLGADGATIDVYLQAELSRGASAGAGTPWSPSELDRAEAFALLDEQLAPDERERCALSALAEAGLLAHDPAEPRGALAAAAAAAVWIAHGELGCRPEPTPMQHAAVLGPFGDGPEQIDAAALWLARLLERHDPAGRGLLAGLFTAARQRSTHAPHQLHARPSFWQALEQVLQNAGESLDDAAIELASARYTLPGQGGARYGLGATDRVLLALDAKLASLPRRATPAAGLATYGSAYARVDTRGAQAGDQLRVWLRGEPGPRWALVAISFDEAGRELGRVSAPTRLTPESFVPIELEPRIAEVALVVTKLPRKRAELPLAPDEEHDCELTIDVAR